MGLDSGGDALQFEVPSQVLTEEKTRISSHIGTTTVTNDFVTMFGVITVPTTFMITIILSDLSDANRPTHGSLQAQHQKLERGGF